MEASTSSITHEFVELISDLVDLGKNTVHACKVFDIMHEPNLIFFFKFVSTVDFIYIIRDFWCYDGIYLISAS